MAYAPIGHDTAHTVMENAVRNTTKMEWGMKYTVSFIELKTINRLWVANFHLFYSTSFRCLCIKLVMTSIEKSGQYRGYVLFKPPECFSKS